VIRQALQATHYSLYEFEDLLNGFALATNGLVNMQSLADDKVPGGHAAIHGHPPGLNES
jgi:hypothetical protein